jgi:signal transduction histidine kinase/CheY-like chemotaxis protein/HPt (histidine-containing phosphotransfer) domain-containing protein
VVDALAMDWGRAGVQAQATVWIALAACLLSFGSAMRVNIFAARGRDLRQALMEARNLADQTSKAKSDFLASMSHEIRTPLNSIIGYSELLFDSSLTPEQRRYAERIHFAGAALLTIVNDVLDFSKIEAGRLEILPKPFALHALIDNTVSIIQDLARRQGLELLVFVDPDLPKALIGDESRIRQILLNLLNNAVKFTLEGKVSLLVKGRRSGDALRVRFVISDTGVGIADEDRERLFQRFSQLGVARTAELGGTGLGLAISKRLVDLMAGEIGFESEPGKGSTFWFELPLEPAGPQSLRQVDAQPQRSTSTPGRVLLVEDLEHNRELAKKILSDAGHAVDTATNGAEALAAIQNGNYDIVLMDIQMPVMDGVTATRFIRQLDHRAANIPIVAMSANVLPDQVRRYKESGMSDHIGKPFKRAELLGALNNWLAKNHRRVSNGKKPASSNDVQSFEEVCEIMGLDWVMGGLEKLRQEIAELFGSAAGVMDRGEMASRAHRLIAHAGLLGFAELSDLCRELERACSNGDDISGHLQRAAACGKLAQEKAGEWLQSRTAPVSTAAN